MFEADRGLRKQIRKAIQQPVRAVREQLDRQTVAGDTEPAEAAQLAVLSDYALAIQTAVNLDGQQPFRYAGLAVDEALTDGAASLAELEKGGPRAAGGVPPS